MHKFWSTLCNGRSTELTYITPIITIIFVVIRNTTTEEELVRYRGIWGGQRRGGRWLQRGLWGEERAAWRFVDDADDAHDTDDADDSDADDAEEAVDHKEKKELLDGQSMIVMENEISFW